MMCYTLYTESRKEKSGSCVAIYISDGFEHKKLDGMSLVDDDWMESIFLEAAVGKQKVNIGCVYRALNTDIKLVTKRI